MLSACHLGEDELARCDQVRDMDRGEQWEVPLSEAASRIADFVRSVSGE